MSRSGAPSRRVADSPAPVKRPLLVWLIYGLGIVGAAVLLLSALFTAGGFFGPDEAEVEVNVSPLAVVLWGGLVALALVTWFVRRRRARA